MPLAPAMARQRFTPLSSGTRALRYYANSLNPQLLCYLYDWSVPSVMPNLELDREGIFGEQTR